MKTRISWARLIFVHLAIFMVGACVVPKTARAATVTLQVYGYYYDSWGDLVLRWRPQTTVTASTSVLTGHRYYNLDPGPNGGVSDEYVLLDPVVTFTSGYLTVGTEFTNFDHYGDAYSNRAHYYWVDSFGSRQTSTGTENWIATSNYVSYNALEKDPPTD